MLLKAKVYDTLKYIALIVLPAFNTLYLGLGQLWSWEHTVEVAASVALVDTFLGAILKISSNTYNNSDASHDGFLSTNGVDPDTGIPNLKLTITKAPEVLAAKDTVRLKVGEPKA